MQTSPCPPGPSPTPPSLPAAPVVPIHPRFQRLPPPVIVIGPHRSGTSVTAAMLAELGVFMGVQSLPHPDPAAAGRAAAIVPPDLHEAAEFYLLNERLLRKAGAAWDRIEPFLERRDEREFAAAAARLLARETGASLRTGFLAPLPPNYNGPWGWKDPRTSLTLPFWLALFPQARVVHVRRDPEAVADSLYRRAHEWQESAPPPPPFDVRLRFLLDDPLALLRAVGRRAGVLPRPAGAGGDPCRDREYARALARRYAEEAQRLAPLAAAVLEVEYDDLLRDPAAAAARMAEFAVGSADGERLARAAALVRPRRTAAEPPG